MVEKQTNEFYIVNLPPYKHVDIYLMYIHFLFAICINN